MQQNIKLIAPHPHTMLKWQKLAVKFVLLPYKRKTVKTLKIDNGVEWNEVEDNIFNGLF